MAREGKKGISNIHFRQTPKEFRSAKQAEVYEHIKKNISYRIYSFAKFHVTNTITKVHGHIKNFATKLPMSAKKIK